MFGHDSNSTTSIVVTATTTLTNLADEKEAPEVIHGFEDGVQFLTSHVGLVFPQPPRFHRK